MSERLVKCIKYNDELPGLDAPPIPGDIGIRIYENVSKKAWNDFIEQFKMIVNEYRLDLTTPLADQILEQKANEYFFTDDYIPPEGYIPEK
jgi:Fe-S cluster biosynthesis and repair protein YggX